MNYQFSGMMQTDRAATKHLKSIGKETPFQKRVEKVKRRYEAYLESDWWRQRRAKAIVLAEGKCGRCGTTERLRAHHLSYERLYAELDEDLKVVCETCHTYEHDREPKSKLKYFYKELMLLKSGTAMRDKVWQEIRTAKSKE